jgi:phosphoserine phosphatase
MTSTAEPVWLFDLDGTVIDVNSFPMWVTEILVGGLPHLSVVPRMSVSVRCAAAIALRKILRESHAGFKRRLQRLWMDVTAADTAARAPDPLVERLLKHVRPSLQALLDDVAKGQVDAVLTTAAAAEYALPLARQLGFRHAIATPPGGREDTPDNVGETKRDRTLAYLVAQGWVSRPRIIFTDHRDDLPLIRECATLVWFGADDECEALSGELGAVEALAARALPGDVTYAWVIERTRHGGVTCT